MAVIRATKACKKSGKIRNIKRCVMFICTSLVSSLGDLLIDSVWKECHFIHQPWLFTNGQKLCFASKVHTFFFFCTKLHYILQLRHNLNILNGYIYIYRMQWKYFWFYFFCIPISQLEATKLIKQASWFIIEQCSERWQRKNVVVYSINGQSRVLDYRVTIQSAACWITARKIVIGYVSRINTSNAMITEAAYRTAGLVQLLI